MRNLRCICVFLLGNLLAAAAFAAPLRIAVASNFSPALHQLVPLFNQQHPDIDLRLSAGASGQLYAQITQGAPFDLYLAANTEYPQALHVQGIAQAPIAYANGRLLLISRHDDDDWLTLLARTQRLGMANPQLAPYGAAAQALLASAAQRQKGFTGRTMTATAIAQVQHWFSAGHVDSAFAAASLQPDNAKYTQLDVTHLLPTPITQQLVILNRSQRPDDARALVAFLLSDTVQALLQQQGYAPLTSLAPGADHAQP